jgi:hypothetical protein
MIHFHQIHADEAHDLPAYFLESSRHTPRVPQEGYAVDYGWAREYQFGEPRVSHRSGMGTFLGLHCISLKFDIANVFTYTYINAGQSIPTFRPKHDPALL